MNFSGQRPYFEKSNSEVTNYVCNQGGRLSVPPLCPPPLADQLVQCWNYDPDNRPTFDTLLKVIKDLLVFKEELQARVCSRYDPSLLSYGTSRDTMRTIAMTLSNSQATTIPCPQRYIQSVNFGKYSGRHSRMDFYT